MVQATQEIPDLDLWVLVASRKVPSQLVTSLTEEARQRGIEFLSISADDNSPSSLVVLCAQAAEHVLEYLQHDSSEAERAAVRHQLDEVIANPGYDQALGYLRAAFSQATIGYDHWRASQNTWLMECFQSESKTRAEFGQPVNIAEVGVRLVERRTAYSHRDSWLSTWGNDRLPFVLLGEEGDGKTWAMASWFNQQLQQNDQFPPVVFISSKTAESQNPFVLISRVLERRNRTLRHGFWEKRVERWLQREEHTTPLLFLVLDGINECWPTSWWRDLFEQLAVSPWQQRIAVVITCRLELWRRHFASLPHIQTTSWVLPGYDENDFAGRSRFITFVATILQSICSRCSRSLVTSTSW
jgi:hypothetical protein